jgi:LmbE family N-acetylglucosaminyl deacetylase
MNILAIGPHPDDIEIGCAGSLIKYARAGHAVFVLVLTSGDVGGDAVIRRKEAEASAQHMGVKQMFWGGFKDTELGADKALISRIEGVIKATAPDMVLVNYSEDTHQDHRASALATVSAARYVKEVLFYEVPTTCNFDPKIYVDIGDVMEYKITALNLHASQVDKTRVKDLTILESANASAMFRGFQGRVKYAEGFAPLRILREIA